MGDDKTWISGRSVTGLLTWKYHRHTAPFQQAAHLRRGHNVLLKLTTYNLQRSCLTRSFDQMKLQDSGHTQRFFLPIMSASTPPGMTLNKHTKTSIYASDALDVWGTIPGTGQAPVKGCHRLIKDTAAEKGRLTLQSYLHNFQPEGCEVEPQWGHFYLKPKGTCIKETGVNESLCSVTEDKTPILQLSWYGIYVLTLLDSA